MVPLDQADNSWFPLLKLSSNITKHHNKKCNKDQSSNSKRPPWSKGFAYECYLIIVLQPSEICTIMILWTWRLKLRMDRSLVSHVLVAELRCKSRSIDSESLFFPALGKSYQDYKGQPQVNVSGASRAGAGSGGWCGLWSTYPALSFQRGPSEGSLISSHSSGVSNTS